MAVSQYIRFTAEVTVVDEVVRGKIKCGTKDETVVYYCSQFRFWLIFFKEAIG